MENKNEKLLAKGNRNSSLRALRKSCGNKLVGGIGVEAAYKSFNRSLPVGREIINVALADLLEITAFLQYGIYIASCRCKRKMAEFHFRKP